ncbi:hypothetical protein GOZ78_24040 [Agrobacterium vitis]|uniref:Apea-like HEPN domain-containing protein n=1 Tax=Agrobacterium vitis TaxID=373 RepID=A0ABD6GJU5_AGRVI|nr:hypothetical protein [Agrobacterium vitis]MUO82238.1 hypothetical protein [Agrobacterium vitis]MUO97564.1 hypothetical protein [Agrobacterium vitis]MUP08165.1 hypothetical protein [Agrobacterium vitis]MUZ85434.1 hypothetical protein [Agrobacterium vitis]MVA13078.1 hypothetical protein [Agrobacterium vitis]
MAKSLNFEAWRLATPAEMSEFLNDRPTSPKRRRKSSAALVVRTRIKPVDIYAYLRARFGEPNGLQNFNRRDDSDNWIHWDFDLRADEVRVSITGTSREVHFLISEPLSDDEWKALIVGLKAEFARTAKAKSEMTKSFEKFVVFQNKFLTLAELCAEMHEAISDARSIPLSLPRTDTKRGVQRYSNALKQMSKRATDLYGDCLKLRMLTPVMAEAFINMVILVFCKDGVRNDPVRYAAFIRATIPERLALLSENCDGFSRPIDQTSAEYGGFKRVMDKRNFAIHGNVEPVREQIETVFFEGKRPLFNESGDNLVKFFEHLDQINAPKEVIADYEAVHLFLVVLVDHLSPRNKWFFEQVINDPFPGYELRKKRVTKILPNHEVIALIPGLRYDDDLSVTW